MMSANVEINFPGILLNRYGASSVSSYKKLTTCGEQWVDEGRMENTKIIDSIGVVYVIKKAYKIKRIGLIPSFLLPYSRRIVRVEYVLDKIEQIGLNDLKKMLCNHPAYKNDREFCYEIDSAKSFLEIAESVGID